MKPTFSPENFQERLRMLQRIEEVLDTPLAPAPVPVPAQAPVRRKSAKAAR